MCSHSPTGASRRDPPSALSPLGGAKPATGGSGAMASRAGGGSDFKFSDSFGDDPMLPDDSAASQANKRGGSAAAAAAAAAALEAPAADAGFGSRQATPERLGRSLSEKQQKLGEDLICLFNLSPSPCPPCINSDLMIFCII